MIEIATNTKGVVYVVTDNPKIADLIREECAVAPVFFTGAPNLKIARGLADGLENEFDRKAVVWRGGHCKFHACFADSR